MKLKQTRNKLLKNGFVPHLQTDRHDQWMDIQSGGADISFYHDGVTLVDGALKVHGHRPDDITTDEFNSSFCRGVKLAISLSRTTTRSTPWRTI